MKRKCIATFLLTSYLINSLSVIGLADTVQGIKSLNNLDNKASYKTDEKDLESIKQGSGADKVETFNYSKGKDLANLDQLTSYIIENDIASREVNIRVENNKLKVIPAGNLEGELEIEGTNTMTKSEFLMGLSKASYGVQKSRKVIIDSKPTREEGGKVVDVASASGKTPEELQEGTYYLDDKYVYITPNVTELYLKQLLDKSIITLSEISDEQFKYDYSNYGKEIDGVKYYPSWAPEKGDYYSLLESDFNALGDSFILNRTGTDFSTKYTPDRLLEKNHLTVIEAYKYIESILRYTEKDMTQTEAEVISYKYGVTALKGLEQQDRDTVSFLVAKGVINFENDKELESLYRPMDMNYAFKLFRRMHSKDARLDFSKVQLTDSDKFWMSKGYFQDTMEITDGNRPIVNDSITLEEFPTLPLPRGIKINTEGSGGVELENEAYMDMSSSNLARTRTVGDDSNADASASPLARSKTTKAYDITRRYIPNGVTYYFDNISIDDYMTAYTSGAELADGVLKDDDGDQKSSFCYNKNQGIQIYCGQKLEDVIELKFRVEADSEKMALARIDALSSFKDNKSGAVVSDKVPAISIIEGGGFTNTFIPKSSIQFLSSELVALDDKHVKNIKTGAESLFLPESGVQIAGNEVIKTGKANIVFGQGDEVFYEAKSLARMMTNAGVSEVMGKYPVFYIDKFKDEKTIPLKSHNTDSELGKLHIVEFETENDKTTKFYNYTHDMTSVSRLITKLPNATDKTAKDVKMLVDWYYIVPESSLMNGTEEVTNPDKSVDGVAGNFYKRPTDPELIKWWDTNINISNAILNHAYGTSNLQYMKTGYLMPKLTFLTEKTMEVKDLQPYLANIKFEANFKAQYLKDKTNFVEEFYNGKPGSVYGTLSSRRNSFILPRAEATEYLVKKDLVKYTGQGGTYIVNARNGNIYKTIASETMMTISDKEAKMKTREGIQPVQPTGVTVKVGKMDLTLHSTSKGYNFIPMSPVRGTLKKSGSKVEFVPEGFKSISEYYKKNLGWKDDKDYKIGDNLVNTVTPAKGFKAEGDYKYAIVKGIAYTIGSKGELTSAGTLADGTKVLAYPMVTFDSTKFNISDSVLVTFKEGNMLQYGNIFFSSINRTIIDTILAKNNKYIPANKIKSGSDVLIGDIRFKVKSGVLTSYPISNPSLVTEILGTDKSKFSQPIGKFMSTISILNDNEQVSLSKYIKWADLGKGSRAMQPYYSNTLFMDNTLRLGKSSNDTVTYKDEIAGEVTSVLISLTLDSNILFRQIDSKSNVYSMVYSTNNLSDGYIDFGDYFSENMGFNSTTGIGGILKQGKFKVMDNAHLLFDAIKAEFSRAMQGDITAILKLVANLYIMWVIVTSWIVFGIKKGRIGLEFLRTINNPYGDKKGIDVIRWFTLGHCTLESDVEVLKHLSMSLIMFILLYGINMYL